MDEVPAGRFTASNVGQQLIAMQRSFKGYSEDLPSIGSEVALAPPGCGQNCLYARKHVPWISFANIPNGTSADTSSNLRFADFPRDFSKLPTVSFVVPNQVHDMHNGKTRIAIQKGDAWLRDHLQAYAQWAKDHQSLLIVTFDENDDISGISGPTDPRSADRVMKNRIPTIFYGAGIKPGRYPEGAGITHVNILRTIEAMYGLPTSGGQQPNALQAGITDDFIITDVFVK